MKITFVDLWDYVSPPGKEGEQLGLLYLAKVIEDYGCKHQATIVSICEMNKNKVGSNISFKQLIETDARRILQFNADIISLYTMCNTYHVALFLAKRIKQLSPNTIILFGGPQATVVAEQTLKKYPYVDGIGLGEGEENIVNILNSYENNDFKNANGLAYRYNNEIKVQYNKSLVSDLDKLPFIDFHKSPKEVISIDVGRGCPFSCTFCSTKSFWNRKFRIKSAKRIYEEIIYYKTKYDINKFSFNHDIFVLNKELVKDLCLMITQNDLNIEWGCSARADTVDKETLQVMAGAGCKDIYFGIESGSERMQREINKNLKINDIKTSIDECVKNNIKMVLSFIYGFPQETEEDIGQTLDLIKYVYNNYHREVKNDRIKIQMHSLMYLPETELTLRYKNQLLYEKTYNMQVYDNVFLWQDEELETMINDIEIFPNMFHNSNGLFYKISDLDVFVTFQHRICELVFNMSYNYILKEFNNIILNLYYELKKTISNEEILTLREGCTSTQINPKEVSIVYLNLKKFILNYKFKNINYSILKEIFTLEEKIFLLAKKKNIDQEKNIVKCNYDVVNILKTKHIIEKRSEHLVEINKCKDKIIVKNVKYCIKLN